MSFLARPARALALSVLLATTGLAGTLPAWAADLTLLLINDVDQMGGRKAGGYDRISGVVAAERAKVGTETGKLLVVHAGDAISPSLMSGFDHGVHIIDLLNIIGVDYFVPGNHEFDFGKAAFDVRMSELKARKLGANLRVGNNPLPGFADTDMIEVGDIKVGLVGAGFDGTPDASSPGDVAFGDTVETVIANARELKKRGADLVVALVHAERGQDIRIARSGAVDVVLSGHDQDLYLNYDNKAVIAESLDQGDQIVAVDIDFSAAEKDGKRTVAWNPTFRVLSTAGVAPDPAVGAKVKMLEDGLSRQLDISLGTTPLELDSRRSTVRTQEAVVGDLITDALRSATGADIAITNGGGIRGNRTYAPGSEITRRDVLTELPFGNRVVVLKLTGADIVDALENGVSRLPDPEGRFPQVSGISFTVDMARPAGSRIADVKVGGKRLNPSATYRVATNDFMANGGDGYSAFRKARVSGLAMDGKLMATEVMNALQAAGSISAPKTGRITIKPAPAAK